MQYALLLKSHGNIRYVQSLKKLAVAELGCILKAWGIPAEIGTQKIGGGEFLVFAAEALSPGAWEAVSRHTAICFAAIREGELLRPVPLMRENYLPDDIAEILKYKGKTNADFTATMMHCAKSASDFAQCQEPLCILDPVCGRGTTLFCALQEGQHALGVEWDTKAVAEADAFFSRYLKYHKIKHRRTIGSLTLPRGGNAKEIQYFFSNSGSRYHEGEGRTLRLVTGDTRDTVQMLGPQSCHLMIGDLPYGVQHAPKQGGKMASFSKLISEVMPVYQEALKPGGAIALSFNEYTLSRDVLEQEMVNAGLTVLREFPFGDFSHWVEQAIQRDIIIGKKETE